MSDVKQEVSIDDKINKLFAVLTTQQAEVEAAEAATKKSWVTKGSFMLDMVNARVNIQTSTENLLIEIEAALLQKEAFFAQAADNLGLTWDGKWDGYEIKDWRADLHKRAAIIGINAKKAKLAELEKRLNGIVSPEQRREMELKAIMASLDDE